MGIKLRVLVFSVVVLLICLGGYLYLKDQNIMIFNPKGIIAEQEKNLIIIVTILMLLVVIPVFIMAAWFPYKYREQNPSALYRPNWDNNLKLEAVWWGLPILIIGVIAVITWRSTHRLDPFKPIAKVENQMNIQVIAMSWKWLFIYPEDDVVSVNKLVIPKDTPVSFSITADAPMNSFWIPQLSGQIYAMNGMSSKLHLVGNVVGDYEGLSANISGEGFSDMRFVATVTDGQGYQQWINEIRNRSSKFGSNEYNQLSIPSIKNVQQQFVLTDKDIYQKVLAKYQSPHYENTKEQEEYHQHKEEKE